MFENTFLIPAQTRTIFCDMDGTIYKYKLNLPDIGVKSWVSKVDGKTRWRITAICEGKHYFVPLLNVNDSGCICLGENVAEKEEFVKALFCTYFNLECVGSIKQYVNLPDVRNVNYKIKSCAKIKKFYKNWEKTGVIELIPFDVRW